MGTCRACGVEIRWARTAAHGRPIPLDPDPTEAGNVLLEYGTDDESAGSPGGGSGAPVAHVLNNQGDVPFELAHLADQPRYMPHHATCEQWSR